MLLPFFSGLFFVSWAHPVPIFVLHVIRSWPMVLLVLLLCRALRG